jgi:hypothetical protein
MRRGRAGRLARVRFCGGATLFVTRLRTRADARRRRVLTPQGRPLLVSLGEEDAASPLASTTIKARVAQHNAHARNALALAFVR